MHQHLAGPIWGNVVIVGIAGAITLACFGLMLRLLWRPEEKHPSHPKYMVMRDDR